MKQLKKRIAMLLAVCLVLTNVLPAYAEELNIGGAAAESTGQVEMEAAPQETEAEIVLPEKDAEEALPTEETEESGAPEAAGIQPDAVSEAVAAEAETKEEAAGTALADEAQLLGTVPAEEKEISYIDENGQEQTHQCIMIATDSVDYKFADNGWYAVEGSVTITNRIINEALAKTPAHLILTDGCELNAPKGVSNVVYYAGSGKKVRGLYIYGQENSTGKLIVTSPEKWHAGIGGQGGQPASTLVINGGTIIAYGAEEGAGIGNGHSNTNNENITITINGGKITAVGGKRAAGIGAGHSGYSPNVIINGGIVRARGGIGGAAIGTGYQTQGGNVYINGGDVFAARAREKLWPKDAAPHTIGPGEDARSYGKTYVGAGLSCGYVEYYNGNPYLRDGWDPYSNLVHIKTLKYRVEHYLQNVYGSYASKSNVSEEFVGLKGKPTEAEADAYEGFTAESFAQQTIADPTPDTPEMVDKEYKGTTGLDFGSTVPEPGSPSTVVRIQYTRNTYTVDYDINIPENAPSEIRAYFVTPASQSEVYGATVSEPEVATQSLAARYAFGGWYREKECKNKVTFPLEMPLGGTTLYAKWTPVQYKITWKVEGQPDYITTAEYADYPVYGKDIPTKEGSDFLGWQAGGSTALGIHQVTGDETYTAYFSGHADDTVIVYFDTHGGKYINPATVSNRSKIAEYPVAVKSGFSFGGWYADANYTTLWDLTHEFSPADERVITLHAKWDYQRPVYWYLKQSGQLIISDAADPALQSASAYHGVFDGSKRFAASEDTWEPYKKLIKTVTTDNRKNNIKPLYCDNWFKGCENVTTIMISSINTSETVSMEYMFSGCAWLDYLNLYSFNTANVTDMSYMFEGCTELLSIAFGPNWNTAGTNEMLGMFKDCSRLTKLDLHTFSFANVTDLSEFFYMCTALNEIVWPTTINVSNVEYFWRTFAFCIELEDIPKLIAPSTVETEEMFRYCKKLTEVDISGFQNAKLKNIQRMFEGCGNLRTIYAAEGMDLSSPTIKYNVNMFRDCISLIGGNGQKYDTHIVNNEYARVDSKVNCGYFTISGDLPMVYVTFEANNGNLPVVVPVVSGNKVTKPADPEYEHYTFLGWFSDPEFKTVYDFNNPVTADITLYGKWEIVSFTINWERSSPSAAVKQLATTSVAFGELPAYPSDKETDLQLTGYVFKGWKDAEGKGITAAEKPTTYYAQYEEQKAEKYYILFDYQNGKEYTVRELGADDIVATPDAPVRTGYDFKGWYTDAACSVGKEFVFGKRAADSVPADKKYIALHAKWTQKQFTVTWKKVVNDEELASASETYAYRSYPQFTESEHTFRLDDVTGYTFAGWEPFVETVTGDAVYQTQYSASEVFIVAFDTNGADVIEPQPVLIGAKATRPENPVKAGYIFDDWYLGNVRYSFDDPVGSSIVLKARWIPKKYAVRWIIDGTEYTDEYEFSTLPACSHPTAKSGYVFTGWNPTVTVIDKVPTEIIKYTAQYEKQTTGGGSGGGGGSSVRKTSAPAGSIAGTWTYHAITNTWTFNANGIDFANRWAYVFNPNAAGNQPAASWFYFDANGIMLTGWQWIRGEDGMRRCYYLNPVPDNTLGACFMGPAVTPDGFTVNESGAWVVNGVIQTR